MKPVRENCNTVWNRLNTKKVRENLEYLSFIIYGSAYTYLFAPSALCDLPELFKNFKKCMETNLVTYHRLAQEREESHKSQRY